MKILIVEDEAAASRRLNRMVNELQPNADVICNLETISSVVNWITENGQPDLLLMDIHLADGSCFEIFKQINITSPIIFITAYDQFALQAFKVNSIDYLLKPVKKDDLEISLKKFEKTYQHYDFNKLIELMLSKNKEKPLRFVVKYGQFIKAIESENVAIFYAEEKSINLITFDKQTFPIDFTLDKLSEMLDKSKFFRINRGVIINYNAISQMYAHLKGRIKIATSIPFHIDTFVSADRTSDFKIWLSGKS